MGQSWGPFKGGVSAQKALLGSKTVAWELLEGTEDKAFCPYEDALICRSSISITFLQKEKDWVSSLTCECIGVVVHSADSTG